MKVLLWSFPPLRNRQTIARYAGAAWAEAAPIAARLRARGLAAPASDTSEAVLRNWRREARVVMGTLRISLLHEVVGRRQREEHREVHAVLARSRLVGRGDGHRVDRVADQVPRVGAHHPGGEQQVDTVDERVR